MKTKKSKTPKATKSAVQTPATKTAKAPETKVTKKTICIEMVSRPGEATLDEIAQAIADRGICSDLKVNRTTASLWMSKIGFAVQRGKDGKYSRTSALLRKPRVCSAKMARHPYQPQTFMAAWHPHSEPRGFGARQRAGWARQGRS